MGLVFDGGRVRDTRGEGGGGGLGLLLGGIAVQVHSHDDQQGAQGKLEGEGVAEEEDGSHAGDDDGEGGGEPFEDVVRVAHHQGHYKPAHGLLHHHHPHQGGVPVEEAVLYHRWAILGQHADHGRAGPKYPQLHVPHPYGGVGLLEDHLEVDAGKA